MTLSPYQLLERTVSEYEDQQRPLTPAEAARRFGLSPNEVAARFERLAKCELLARVDEGYRPTVTARELLELDVNGGLLIIDTVTEC